MQAAAEAKAYQQQHQQQQPYPNMPPPQQQPYPYMQPPQQQPDTTMPPPPPKQPPQLPRSGSVVADRVASGLLVGSQVLAAGIGRAASATSQGIANYAERQKKSKLPNEQPASVSPAVHTSIKVAGVAATAAAAVTGTLASLVGSASYAIAAGVASTLSGSSKKKKKQKGQKGAVEGEPQSEEEVTPEEQSALKTIGAAGLMSYVAVSWGEGMGGKGSWREGHGRKEQVARGACPLRASTAWHCCR